MGSIARALAHGRSSACGGAARPRPLCACGAVQRLNGIIEGRELGGGSGAGRRPHAREPFGCNRACFATVSGDATRVVEIDLNNLGQTRTPPSAACRSCCETRTNRAGTPRRAPRTRADRSVLPRGARTTAKQDGGPRRTTSGAATAATAFPRCGSKRCTTPLTHTVRPQSDGAPTLRPRATRAAPRPPPRRPARRARRAALDAELVGAAAVIAGLLCGLRRPQSQPAYGSVAPARAS
jgi:hypothetical protein